MEVKVGHPPGMGPDVIRKERDTLRLISFIRDRDSRQGTSLLPTMEAVQQRRRDALRITELTLRATATLGKLNNN